MPKYPVEILTIWLFYLFLVLDEFQVRTYSVDGWDFEVEVLDIGYDYGLRNVQFMVNGEVTRTLNKGDSYFLANGFELRVDDIDDNDVTFCLYSDVEEVDVEEEFESLCASLDQLETKVYTVDGLEYEVSAVFVDGSVATTAPAIINASATKCKADTFLVMREGDYGTMNCVGTVEGSSPPTTAPVAGTVEISDAGQSKVKGE